LVATAEQRKRAIHLQEIGALRLGEEVGSVCVGSGGEGVASADVEIRVPTEEELGLLYAWLKEDEDGFEVMGGKGKNPAPYWSNAGENGALQAVWEEVREGGSEGRSVATARAHDHLNAHSHS